jgi:hypothetical protein
MTVLTAILGTVLLISVVLDVFETIVLPRRVTRRLRFTAFFYRFTWRPFAALARHIRRDKRREGLLAFYGPASLLLLLVLWAVTVTFAFALLQYAAGSAAHAPGFATDLYYSGTTIFTLGLGDILPRSPVARFLTVVESGFGLGLLALVIGYFPVIYQSFSRREINVSLLDGRAGTPPSAGELLQRYDGALDALSSQLLREWELWAAELLETHLSYPLLAYFRSQHDNQNWLAGLTMILDISALLTVALPDGANRQAYLTFAIARHTIVDLTNIFHTPPRPLVAERLSPADSKRLRALLGTFGLSSDDGLEQRLTGLRTIYEPYANALARYLLVTLPPWVPADRHIPNWLTTAWGRTTAPPSVAEPFDGPGNRD